jgi:hypothetical protein
MISVQIYIKKNTLVQTGSVTTANTSPYTLVKNSAASYTTNQYTGHYIKITAGTGLGSITYIVSNTATELTLQVGIQTDTTTQYEIYRADYQKLDLFSDEKISVTSSVANVNDIGKVFTDYSQSFTIPASDRNNQILSHWYESTVDNGYDHRQRYDGYVEIDTQRFKDGNFQLEKANKKNGFIESYSVTFYGNLTQLKDRFKDIKLRDLPTGILAGFYGTDNYWNIFNHTYNPTEIKNRITATTLQSVYYPLIGSQRKYYYKNAVAAEDITLASAPVKWNELFPAVSMSTIFSLIQLCFGITFTGSFFNLDQWKKLYLYLKNSETLSVKSLPLLLKPNVIGVFPFPEWDSNTGTLTTNWNFASGTPISLERQINVIITPTNSSIPYTLFVYKNNTLFTTFQGTGTLLFIADRHSKAQEPNNSTYQFKVSFNDTNTYTSFIAYKGYLSSNLVKNSQASDSATRSTIREIQLSNFVPDITVSDFVSGIVKAFNLMIIPKDLNTFEFVPLEMYYNEGKILDITKYVYADEMEVERSKLFKAINFQYEKSPNILNNAYKSLYNTEYGDLIYNPISSNESSNYDIKLPFENVLFEKTIGENFLTATLIDKDRKPYLPKPMLIYNNGITSLSTPVIMTTEPGTTTFSTYNRFSNEYDSIPTDTLRSGLMTMNFSNEQSPWYNVLAPQGLYYRHYKNYIDNLYNIKTRIVKVKALFPPSLLASTVTNGDNKKLGIALNDRLVIRNKRYIINNMTTDLTTGEASLELITDYRGVNAANSVGYKFATYSNLELGKEATDFETIIYLNDYDYFGVKGATNFLSYPITGAYEYTDLLLPVSVPENTSGLQRYDEIGIDFYKDGILTVTEYIRINQLP